MSKNTTEDDLQQTLRSLAKSPHTRTFDAIAKEVGAPAAQIFGVVFRHSIMKNSMCYASKTTLAELLGTSRSSIFRHVTKLVEDGYLVDHTPDEKFRPHAYTIGAKGLETLQNTMSNCTGGMSNCTGGMSNCNMNHVKLTHEESIKNQLNNLLVLTRNEKFLSIVSAYYELRFLLMQYYLENMELDADINSVDSAIGLMLEDCAARLSQGEVLTDDILFDDATFGDALLSAGMIGADDSYLSELFRRPVVVVDQSE